VVFLTLGQVPIAEAMREMLESFRLPGEAQQIERITDTFAAKYFGSEPGMLHLALEVGLLMHLSFKPRSVPEMRSTFYHMPLSC
jgi:hypothetical protein